MHCNAKITSKNQTTLPGQVRTALNVGPGDTLIYRVSDDGRVTMEKDTSSLDDLAGIVTSDVSLTDAELDEAVAEARESIAAGHGRD